MNNNFSYQRGGMLSVCLLAFIPVNSKETNERPNILFAISDDQSFPHAGAYGCSWVNTPAFDYVAENGLLFMNSYTPNAKSAPSRSSIVTGRNSWQLEEAGNHVCIFPDKFKSFCEILDEKTNYSVAYSGKGVEPVVVHNRNLTGKSYNALKTETPGSGISSIDYAGNFKAFLNEKPENKPFFFWYGGFEPHRKYQYRIGIEKGGKSLENVDKVPYFWPDNEIVRTDMLDYAFEIDYFDKHLMEMISFLEETGELDNTIIIVTSDNGMPFPRCKGNSYEYSNHMPLAIMWPKGIKNPGRIIKDYISFIDFAPTILELAGIDDPVKAGMQPFQGKSLEPIFKSEKDGLVLSERDHVILGQERHDVGRPGDAGYPVRSLIKDSFMYIYNFKPNRWPACDPVTGYLNTDGSPTKTFILDINRNEGNPLYWVLNFGLRVQEELYDLKRDPECILNLAIYPEHANRMDAMKRQLFGELAIQGDPRVLGDGDVFDRYPYGGEDMRNFYERYMQGKISKSEAGWVNESDFENTKPY